MTHSDPDVAHALYDPIERGIALVRHFELECEQSKSLLVLELCPISSSGTRLRVKPVEPNLALFQIGIIDEEGLREHALTVGTAMVEQPEEAVAGIGRGCSRGSRGGGALPPQVRGRAEAPGG